MINEELAALGAAPNKIRSAFAYGLARKAEIGADKVFDLSIGNPSVPAPQELDKAVIKIAEERTSAAHAYSPSPGLQEVREKIAANLNERFNTNYTFEHLYLTAGSAAALAVVLKAIVMPGQEVITVAPYFTEYKVWTKGAGAELIEVPARSDDFQIDIDAMEAAINEKTACVIINTPNNPVGTVYSEENLRQLAAVLEKKSQELGKCIYLISDEPYRELYYEKADKPSWIPSIYKDTIVTYSWSKSMSLAGERIAYLLVGPDVEKSKDVYNAIVGAARLYGYICVSVTFQKAVAACIDAPVDTATYDENRKLFMDGLRKIGYTFIEPKGAYYLWIKSLEPSSDAFCERAKACELLIVPGIEFGQDGWVRAGYCCEKKTIEGALGAFQKLWDEYHA